MRDCCDVFSVFSCDPLDPRQHLSYSGVDSWILLLSASYAPADNTNLFTGSTSTGEQRTTGVSLKRQDDEIIYRLTNEKHFSKKGKIFFKVKDEKYFLDQYR